MNNIGNKEIRSNPKMEKNQMTKQQKIDTVEYAEIIEPNAKNSNVEVVETPHRSLKMSSLNPVALIESALENGAGVDVLESLFSLNERIQNSEAVKAFNAAISDARAEIGPITKNRTVDFTSKNGAGRTNYKFEDLAEIARTIDPTLAKFGLSYRYNTEQNGNMVRVTCIVSHRAGYSEKTSLEAPVDTTGNKSGIQGIGSTITFLQRYTLKSALGLAASNDDDGQAANNARPAAPALPAELSGKQVKRLRDLIVETGTDEKKFLGVAKAQSLEDIAPAEFKRFESLLLRKKADAAQAVKAPDADAETAPVATK